MWGPKGEIIDYAAKMWAGVVADYYKPRWEMFINDLHKAMTDRVPFNQTAYKTKVFDTVEKPFTFDTKYYADQPTGNSYTEIFLLRT